EHPPVLTCYPPGPDHADSDAAHAASTLVPRRWLPPACRRSCWEWNPGVRRCLAVVARPGLGPAVWPAGAPRAPARRDPARWDPARWGPAHWDPARWDPAGRDPAHWDPAGRAPAQWDPARDSAGWDPAR